MYSGFFTNKTDRHDIAEICVESGVKHHKPNQSNLTMYNMWVVYSKFDHEQF